MKSLCFIFLLLLAVISPSLAVDEEAPDFNPFQRVIYTILTRNWVFSFDYWWNVKTGTLTTGYTFSPDISRQGNSFLHTIKKASISPLHFAPPHPSKSKLSITGTLTFTPPDMVNYPGADFPSPDLPRGSLPPGTFAADLDTVRFSHFSNSLFHIDIAGVLVTILRPNRRHLDPEEDAVLRDRQRIVNWYQYQPRLPRPVPDPDPSEEPAWSSSVEVQYLLDDTTWRSILEDEVWELDNEDIFCSYLGGNGPTEDYAVRLLSPAYLLGGPESWLSWLSYRLWGDISLLEAPPQPRTPITDCSHEASTSGTKNEKDEFRR
jgi:hypothetical protein